MTALRSRARSLISAWSRLSSWGAAMPKHKGQRAGLRQADELPEERPRGLGIEAVVHVRRPAVRVARYSRIPHCLGGRFCRSKFDVASRPGPLRPGVIRPVMAAARLLSQQRGLGDESGGLEHVDLLRRAGRKTVPNVLELLQSLTKTARGSRDA